MTPLRAAAPPPAIQNRSGLKLLVVHENTDPTLRIVLPGHPDTDRAIEVIFPEHVTVRRHGSAGAEHLYLFRPGIQGERVAWRRAQRALEYERELPGMLPMRARATLEQVMGSDRRSRFPSPSFVKCRIMWRTISKINRPTWSSLATR